MTTREAFEHLTKQRGWYKDLDITEDQATNLKRYFKVGTITIDKMEEVLTKAGFKVKQEKLWQK